MATSRPDENRDDKRGEKEEFPLLSTDVEMPSHETDERVWNTAVPIKVIKLDEYHPKPKDAPPYSGPERRRVQRNVK